MLYLPGPDGEYDEHTDTCDHKQRLPTKSVDEEDGKDDGNEERPNLQTTVEQGLIGRVRDSYRAKDVMEVIRHETVARTLTKERRKDDQEQSLSVARCLEEDEPSLAAHLLLHTDGLLDFGELGLDEHAAGVTVGVILLE